MMRPTTYRYTRDYRGEPVEPVRLRDVLASTFRFIASALLVAAFIWVVVYGAGVSRHVFEAL